MAQQGQVFAMKSNGPSGAPLWGYRYRTGGRGSRPVQLGGFVSERDAKESLEQVRRANGTGSTLTLAALVDEYLAQHDAQPGDDQEAASPTSSFRCPAVEWTGVRCP